MVCLPCIVIPFLLWVFHKYIQPYILKFWNPSGKSITQSDSGPPSGVSPDNKEYLYIKEQISQNPVMMFSKTTCNYCKMARDVLNEVDVDYTTEEIDGREDCSALQDMFEKITGQRTAPRIFIGGKCIGGGTDLWTLHNQNKLVPMMKECGAAFRDRKND